ASPNASADQTTAAASINPLLKPLTKTFLRALSSPSPTIPLTACLAVSKLLLLSLFPAAAASDLLRALTLAFFNPATAANPALRQALSYFLPVFCHSRLANARLMAQIAVGVVGKLVGVREELDEEDEEMVAWVVVAGMFAEWTDGRKVVGGELGSDGSGAEVHGGVEDPHVLLATEILERALTSGCSKDERKPLLTLLAKLHIPSSFPTTTPPSSSHSVDATLLSTLHALVTEAIDTKLAPDAISRNTLSKLDIALSKRLGEVEYVVQSTEVPDITEAEADAEAAKEEAEEEAEAEGETDDETLLGEAQAEGTRFPLGGSEEEEEESRTVREATVEGDDSVVDRLLESEDEVL
ncbi:hypothetical protein K432DRAFT_392570, partial [Lepidopterella palustris CBS 459.81]